MKLNLGCGDQKLPGYVNVDLFGQPDQRVDLFKFPWPWSDNSITEIYCDHFLEHVKEFMRTWREVHRVLQPGGKLTVIVPNWRSTQAPWPENHLHSFSIYTFKYHLRNDAEYSGGKYLFKTIRLRHLYGPKLKFLTPFANISPLFWDWMGLPVSEIEWSGVKI